MCEDAERAEELMEYFDTVEKITDSSLFFKSIERAEQVAREFSDKGLYYFDSDDGTRFGIATLHEYYTKLPPRLRPIGSNERLPEHIRDLLGHNRMDVEDFSAIHVLHVKHAYEVRI